MFDETGDISFSVPLTSPLLPCKPPLRIKLEEYVAMSDSGAIAGSGDAGDPILDEMRARFFCALISDVLDGLGYTSQVMAPHVRPLDESLVMVGRARHDALCGRLRAAWTWRKPLRSRNQAGRQPRPRRHRGFGLRGHRAHRAVGRSPEYGVEDARRSRCGHGRLRARHPTHPLIGIPGLRRRHCAARQPWPREGH